MKIVFVLILQWHIGSAGAGSLTAPVVIGHYEKYSQCLQQAKRLNGFCVPVNFP